MSQSRTTRRHFTPRVRKPMLVARIWRSSARLVRRRFFFLASVAFLSLIVLVFAVLLFLFRRDPVNDAIEMVAAELLNLDNVTLDFARDRTEVSFPRLNGTGSVHLYDISIESPTNEYRLVHIPHVRIDYDLLGLPNRPLSRVVIDQGLYAVANISEDGTWVDQSFLKQQPDDDSPSSFRLPEILLKNGFVRFRAPMALNEPSEEVANTTKFGIGFTHQGKRGHYLSNIEASLLQDPANPNVSHLNLVSNCSVWGRTTVTGAIDLDGDNSFRVVKRNLQLDQALVDRLDPKIAVQLDRVFANEVGVQNFVDLSANLDLPANGEARILAQASLHGSLMYRDVPVLLQDVSGLIEFNGKDLKIIDSSARRGAAFARAYGSVDAVGTENERLDIQIAVDGLVISPDLLRSIVGEQTKDGDRVFKEWEQFRRPGSLLQPNPPPIIAKLREWLEPSGLMSARVRYGKAGKDLEDNVSFRVILADVSARYSGDTNAATKMVAETAAIPDPFDLAAAGVLRRLEGALPAPIESHSEAFVGYPLPLYDISGVVSGEIGPGKATEVRLQGVGPDDERQLEETLGIRIPQNRLGLTANRADTSQKFFLEATFRDRSAPSPSVDDSRLTARVSTNGFEIDDQVVSLLPLSIQRQIDEYGLRGAVDVDRADFTIDSINENAKLARAQITLAAKSIGASYRLPGAEEPLSIDRVKGSLSYNLDRNSIALRDIEGVALGSTVKAGQINVVAQRLRPMISVSADLGLLAINSALFRKLPKELGAFEVMLGVNPTGTLGGTIELEIGDSRTDVTLRLKIKGTTITHEAIAPFTLHQAEGEFTIALRDEGIEVRIHKFSGIPGVPVVSRVGSTLQTSGIGPDMMDGRAASRVMLSGGVFIPGQWAADSRTAIDIHIEGENVLLSSEIKAALDGLAGGTPKAPGAIASLWSSLEPMGQDGQRGPIGRVAVKGDLAMRISNKPSSLETIVDYLMNVTMSNGNVRFDGFPMPLSNVEMHAILAPDVVQFVHLSAMTEGSVVHVPRLSMSGGNLLMDVAIEKLPLDSAALRGALPVALRGPIGTISPTGLMDASIAIRLTPDRMEFDAELKLVDVGMTFGVPFTKMQGDATIHGEFSRDAEAGVVPLLVKGQLQFDEAFWKGVKMEDVTTVLQFTGDRLVMPNLRGTVHGGVFQGNLNVNLDAKNGAEFAGAISARGILLESLAKAIAGGEAKEGDERMIGGMDAELAFFSPDENGLMGRGRIDIGRVPLTPEQLENLDTLSEEERKGKPAELGAVPLFGGIYRELGLSSSEYFNEAALVFQLQANHIEVRQMNLISDAIRIETVGQSRIYYDKPLKGDQIELVFVPTLFPRTVTIPLAQGIFDAFKGVVLRIFVGGTLDAPEVRPFSNRRAVEDDERRKLPEPVRSRLDG